MSIYMFLCECCGAGKSISQSMEKEIPKTLMCEKCKKNMRRDFQGESKTTAIIIPEHMTAIEVNKPQIKYDKSPSRRKHFY